MDLIILSVFWQHFTPCFGFFLFRVLASFNSGFWQHYIRLRMIQNRTFSIKYLFNSEVKYGKKVRES